MNQTADDLAVLNADDPVTADWANGRKAGVTLFSVKRELDEGLFLRGRELVCRSAGKETVLTTRDEIFLRGLHNVENILAALAAGLACEASPESMRETIRTFKGVEHRNEYVDEIDGIKFYNDSKATSVDATLKALEALGEGGDKIVLLLGGRGKNAPYAPLIPLIQRSVRKVVVLGEDAKNIETQLEGSADIEVANSFEDAVQRAHAAAKSGDSVLLAPACASFDMFRSFEERGQVFKSEVAKLKRFEGSRAHNV
jgi:UDP-N-acetylmuramoylalanine--D-glutamate ligase